METAFPARGLAEGDPPFALLRCPSCGFGATDPAVPESEIGRWYPPAYYGKENVRFLPIFERLVRLFRERRAGTVAEGVRQGPVLDVGCGRGLMLSFLRERGFEPHGMELSDESAWHARNKLGIPIHVGPLAQGPWPAGYFQMVIFWHSLEHVIDPVAAIAEARRLLKPEGRLVVAVPNSDSLQAGFFGASWFHLDIPRHYLHFGTRSLRRLLTDHGFRVERVDHLSLEQNPYGWLQSFFNALRFDFNFLYSLIKTKSARMHNLARHPLQTILTILMMPVFVPLAGLLTLAESAVGRGGTIELYATRVD
jgi:2-polyprenyl-3-methyl-5-hydroxy-6-metoxy-1,4-benzoquinol methylase